MLESFFRDPTKLPTVPSAVDPTEGNFRWPFVVLMFLGGLGGILGAVVGFFLRASSFSGWSLTVGIVCIVLGQIAIPRS